MIKQKHSARQQQLEALRRKHTACSQCALRGTDVTYVFGTGNPDARIVFIGEAPGSEENRQGEPFVGRAGKLLNKTLENAGLTRQEVYITNVVKCRPMRDPSHPEAPGNDRPPTKTEIAACLPVLEQQLRIIEPRVICTLGNTPLHTLLDTTEGIGKLHGTTQTYRGIILIPTYHPAAIFRNPSRRDALFNDVRIAAALTKTTQR